MNTHTISILFLKDLYLSRRPLFAILCGGDCVFGHQRRPATDASHLPGSS